MRILLPRKPPSAKEVAVPEKSSVGGWLKIALLLGLLAGGLILSRFVGREQIIGFIERVRAFGWPGYVVFVVFYAFWIACGLPASVLTLAGAVTFGFWRALGLVLIGAGCGAILGFLFARHVARDWFTEKIGKRMALVQINRAVGESGWKLVMLSRLPPVSPFSIMNYAYGLTPIRLRDFALGTFIGMIPGTAAYVYLGTILGSVAEGSRDRTPLEWTIYVCGLLATIAVCVYFVRLARAALARHAIEK